MPSMRQTLIERIKDPRKNYGLAEKDLDTLGVIFNGSAAPAVDDNGDFWSTIMLAAVDEEGEVILPGGTDTTYFPKKHQTVFLNHDYDSPVGICRKMVATANAVRAETHLLSTSLGRDVRTMIEAGAIRGVSVGTMRVQSGPPSQDELARFPGCQRVTSRNRLVEYSVTPMPMLADATIDSKAMEAGWVTIKGLLSAGRIYRSSAVKAGLPETEVRKTFPVSGAAKVGRPAIVMEDGSVWR